jgi:hypothetical protein
MDERDTLAQRRIEHKFVALDPNPTLVTVFETKRDIPRAGSRCSILNR